MLFAKVGIKSCRGARECVSFVHVCICSYPAAILYLSRHMQYTMNAAWVVSDSYIASYLFMSIPTSLFKFNFFKTLVSLSTVVLNSRDR